MFGRYLSASCRASLASSYLPLVLSTLPRLPSAANGGKSKSEKYVTHLIQFYDLELTEISVRIHSCRRIRFSVCIRFYRQLPRRAMCHLANTETNGECKICMLLSAFAFNFDIIMPRPPSVRQATHRQILPPTNSRNLFRSRFSRQTSKSHKFLIMAAYKFI